MIRLAAGLFVPVTALVAAALWYERARETVPTERTAERLDTPREQTRDLIGELVLEYLPPAPDPVRPVPYPVERAPRPAKKAPPPAPATPAARTAKPAVVEYTPPRNAPGEEAVVEVEIPVARSSGFREAPAAPSGDVQVAEVEELPAVSSGPPEDAASVEGETPPAEPDAEGDLVRRLLSVYEKVGDERR